MRHLWILALLFAARAAWAAPRFVVQSGHNREVREVRVSPTGRLVATLSDDSLRLWDRNGILQWSLRPSGAPQALAWSRDGRKLAVGFGGEAGMFAVRAGESAGILELAADDGSTLRRLPFGNNVIQSIEYLPDGALQATSGDGVVKWPSQGERVTTRQTQPFAFSPDGLWQVRSGTGLEVVEVRSGKTIAKAPRFADLGFALRWSQDSQLLAAFDGATVWVWDHHRSRSIPVFTTGKAKSAAVKARPLEFPPDVALAIAPDDHTLLCTRTDYPQPRLVPGQIDEQGAPRGFLWRIDTGSGKVQTLRKAVPRFYGALDFWPDGTLVLGGGREVEPQIYASELYFAELQNSNLRMTWSAPQPLEAALQLALSPDGKTLAIGGEDTAVRLWDLTSGRLLKSLKEYSSSIVALDFSPDGKRVGALDYSNFFLFDIATGRARKYPGLEVFGPQGNGVSFSPDGGKVVLGSGAGVKIIDLASGYSIAKNEGWFPPLRWTRAGLWINGGLQLMDGVTFKPRLELNGRGVGSERPRGGISDFDFVPGQAKLLTVTPPGDPTEIAVIQRWNIKTDVVERTLTQFPGASCVSVAPDETRFAAGSSNGEVAIFDLETLQPAWQVSIGAAVNDIHWSRDQFSLFVAGADGLTRVFTPAGHPLATFCALPALRPSAAGYQWLRYSPDGKFAASREAVRQVRLFEDGQMRALIEDSQTGRKKLEIWHGPNRPLVEVAGLPAPAQPAAEPPVAPVKVAALGPKLILQGDKIYQFSHIAVSNGGKWLATSQGERGNIQLSSGRDALKWDDWPISSGDTPLLFTPDSTRLLTRVYKDPQDYEEPVVLVAECAVPSGRRLHTFALPTEPLWCDDAKVRGIKDNTIFEFDLKSGRLLSRRPIQSPPHFEGQAVPRYAFSRNGQFLVEGSAGTIRWWRVSDGKLLGSIRDILRAIGRTTISDDGQWLASEGDDPAWRPPTEASSEAAYARTFRLHVWATSRKKLLQTMPGYYSLNGGALLLAFSADGTVLFGANENGLDRYIWRTGRNSPIPPPQKDFRRLMGWPLALSNNGQFLAGAGMIYQSSDYGPGLQLWDTRTSKLVAHCAGTLRGAAKLKWSPDGRYLAGGDRLTLWDAKTGALLAEEPRAYAYQFEWVDSQTIRSRTLGKIEWYQAPELKKLRELDFSPPQAKSEAMDQYSDGVSISPDGALALTMNPTRMVLRNELWVWNIASKAVERKISISQASWGYTEMDRIVWLPDSRRMVYGTSEGMTLLNVQTGSVEKQWHDPVDPAYRGQYGNKALAPVAVSSDGKWLVARAARDNTALVYDLQSEEFVRRLPVKGGYHAQFLKDARTIVLETSLGLQWWDVAAEASAPQRMMSRVPAGEWSLSPDERQIVFGSNSASSNGVSIWSTVDGREKVRLYLLGGTSETTTHDWIALTPEGFYDASPQGELRLRWRDEHGFWPFERSRLKFRSPGKVAAALNSQ